MNIAILTINDNNNLGNRLQNYALQEFLKRYGEVYTIINNTRKYNNSCSIIAYLKRLKFNIFLLMNKRYKYFFQFNKLINFYDKKINENNIFKRINDIFDYFVVGSDQVWNPRLRRFSDIDFLKFSSNEKKISYAASIGISDLTSEEKSIFKKGLINFKNISVREDAAKEIISEITHRDDVNVHIDPTMLISRSEWENVMKKPHQLECEKYVFCYFLGDISQDKKNIITSFAKKHDYEIVDISDKTSKFHNIGPSEFLYLEANAQLICTDSFHSCVFSIIFGKPFIVFDREGTNMKMSSRLDTLTSKFNLSDRKYNGVLDDDLLVIDYSHVNEIIELERKKSIEYFDKIIYKR